MSKTVRLDAQRNMGTSIYKLVTCFMLLSHFLGCPSSPDLLTPVKIGKKERIGIISGKKAAQVVNRMHGRSVASDANVIAEYGRDKKDLLYISYYADQKESKRSLDLMIEKMTSTKKGPFFHLKPLGRYQNKVYITLGMGAIHYVYASGNFLLWLQTFQSFGDTLPHHLLQLYPV
jgi:hypothetical protein